jgi:hypothetical protein
MKPSRILHEDENGVFFNGVNTTYRPGQIKGAPAEIRMDNPGFIAGDYLHVKHVLYRGIALLYVSNGVTISHWANDFLRETRAL